MLSNDARFKRKLFAILSFDVLCNCGKLKGWKIFTKSIKKQARNHQTIHKRDDDACRGFDETFHFVTKDFLIKHWRCWCSFRLSWEDFIETNFPNIFIFFCLTVFFWFSGNHFKAFVGKICINEQIRHENFITFEVRLLKVDLVLIVDFPENNFPFHFPSSSIYRLVCRNEWPFLTFVPWLGWALEELLFCIKMTWSSLQSAFYLLLPLSIFLWISQHTIHHSLQLFVISATSALNWLPFARLSPFFITFSATKNFTVKFDEFSNFSERKLRIKFDTKKLKLSIMSFHLANPLWMSFKTIEIVELHNLKPLWHLN